MQENLWAVPMSEERTTSGTNDLLTNDLMTK